jgi:glycosyltransferase involved in cell wall biosynthesis
VPPARLQRIYNGIAIESATTGAAAPPAKGPVAVTVGRVSEQKNYGLLIECWKDISPRVPGAELWIIGDGEDRATLEERARVLGLGSVKFWGWRKPAEVAAMLGSADVFVLSSKHEALPTSMLEAYAAGLPAVSTRVGGVGEIIEDGVSGFIVDDAAGLTRALASVLAMPPAERAAMGAKGRDRVLREFTADRFVREVEQTYRECVA